MTEPDDVPSVSVGQAAEVLWLDRRDYERHLARLAAQLEREFYALAPFELWRRGVERQFALAVLCVGCGQWIVADKQQHLEQCDGEG